MVFFQSARLHKLANSLAIFVKSPFVLFFVVLLVSACCKLSALNSRELWLDETYSAFVANLPVAELPRHLAGEYNPPFFYILLWAWVRAFGDTQAHLRLFGVVLNICSIAGMYVLARRILGVSFGALAAVLFAFSPMLFVYSLEVRSYMLAIFVFIGLLIAHWAVAVERREEKWLIAAYAMLAALLFYINYIGIFILIGLCIHWTISTCFVRGRVIRLCAAGILIILFLSPGIPALLERNALKTQLAGALELSHQNPDALSFGAAGQNAGETARIKGVAKSAAAMAGFYPAASPLLLLLCALPLAVALAGAGYLAIMEGDELCRLFGLVSLAIGMGAIAAHLSATRYLLPLVPLLVLAVARAVQYGSAKPRWRVASLAAGTLILCLYAAGFFRQSLMPHGRPWQNLVSTLQQNYQPGDTVVFDVLYAQVPFDYFARHAHFQPRESGFPLSIYEWWDKQPNEAWGGPVILRSDLDQYITGLSASRPKTLWLVLYETYYYDPHEALLNRLGQLGQVSEFRLPPDRDASDPQEALRLIRVSFY
ncbi:MAG: glycosyltransferase family 39 protein [Terracidiphilus sp.]|jgi:4-amino-4-deoxy-L-arabinose transferase-like glycosyltransferase